MSFAYLPMRTFSVFNLMRSLILGVVALCFSAMVPAQNSKPLTKVRYEEVVRSILYVPTYVAFSQGFFREAGLDVSMKTSQGTDKGMAALLSGSADIVLIGPEATIYVANSESPVKPKIFAGLTATDGFLLMSKKPVEKFEWRMLKGKTIMSFRPGSNPDVFLEAALRKHGLDPKVDVKLVNNIGPAARTGAWLAGQTDYAIFLEPEASSLEGSANGYALASIGNEVGQVDYTVFTATDSYIKKNPEIVQTWTNVIARAEKYVAGAPSSDIAKQVAEFFVGMSQADLVKAIDRYQKYRVWKATPVIEPAAIESLQDMLIADGVLESRNRVKYEQVVDPSFARNAK